MQSHMFVFPSLWELSNDFYCFYLEIHTVPQSLLNLIFTENYIFKTHLVSWNSFCSVIMININCPLDLYETVLNPHSVSLFFMVYVSVSCVCVCVCFQFMHVCFKSWGAGLSAQITESTLQPVLLFMFSLISLSPSKNGKAEGGNKVWMNERVKNIRPAIENKRESVWEREREREIVPGISICLQSFILSVEVE